ncbi:protein yellow-like [Cloeon dipterum]|uniref:protein yellow-like n=1 Tax=Cloeon dipterum TaxID=197152 RepID=UPI003220061D
MSPFVAAIFLLGLSLANAINFTTVYEWETFDFTWPPESDTSNGRIRQNFNPTHVHLEYMAVFGERLFLSFDIDYGIPGTLVWLPKSDTSTASPMLQPFPSLNLHKKENCDTIQWTRGVEADPEGRLWVLDKGSGRCPSKLWIFDLVNNDTTDRVHQFPDAVVSHSYYGRELRDIVLDKTPDDYLAYITDIEANHIVVYSRKMDKSWSVGTPERAWKSLALSPNKGQLYLSRYGSNELYSVSVSELKNGGGSAGWKFIGRWTASPYRMLIDSANVLYAAFSYQSEPYLSTWNISEPFLEQRFHEVGTLDADWPFTFALDTNGTFWMTQRNETQGKYNSRHKLLKAAVSARSYLFGSSKDLSLRG